MHNAELHDVLAADYDRAASPAASVAINVTVLIDDLFVLNDDEKSVSFVAKLYLQWVDRRRVS